MVAFITRRYVEKASGNGPHGLDDTCKFEFDAALMERHLGAGKIVTVVMESACRRETLSRDCIGLKMAG